MNLRETGTWFARGERARRGLALILVLCTGLVLLDGVTADTPPPQEAHDYYLRRGVEETGAINLVSAIYLGYRAFDTLGETIVFLVAIAGALYMVEEGSESRP